VGGVRSSTGLDRIRRGGVSGQKGGKGMRLFFLIPRSARLAKSSRRLNCYFFEVEGWLE